MKLHLAQRNSTKRWLTSSLVSWAPSSISHPRLCCPFCPCSCHHLQIFLAVHPLCCFFLWRSLASLHWATYATVKSHWELITFVILCMLIQSRALRLRQTDAGEQEAWIKAVSSGGRQGGLDSIPNHPQIPSFWVMAVKKDTKRCRFPRSWGDRCSTIWKRSWLWTATALNGCPKRLGFWPCSELQVFSMGHPNLRPSYNNNIQDAHTHTHLDFHIRTHRA